MRIKSTRIKANSNFFYLVMTNKLKYGLIYAPISVKPAGGGGGGGEAGHGVGI